MVFVGNYFCFTMVVEHNFEGVLGYSGNMGLNVINYCLNM